MLKFPTVFWGLIMTYGGAFLLRPGWLVFGLLLLSLGLFFFVPDMARPTSLTGRTEKILWLVLTALGMLAVLYGLHVGARWLVLPSVTLVCYGLFILSWDIGWAIKPPPEDAEDRAVPASARPDVSADGRRPDETTRTYEHEGSSIVTCHLGIWFFGAIAAMMLVQALNAYRTSGDIVVLGYFGMLSAVGAGISAFSYVSLRRTRMSSIAVDGEGIWNVRTGRERGFVRWSSIRSVRERASRQRLELVGVAGERLLDIEYQLRGFDELRSIIVSKTPKPDVAFPRRYARGAVLILFEIAFALLLLAGIGWALTLGKLWHAAGLLLVVGLCLHDFFMSAFALTLSRERLIIEYPWRKVEILLSEIEEVSFSDVSESGVRTPRIALRLASGKVIELRNLRALGTDAVELHRQLSANVRE